MNIKFVVNDYMLIWSLLFQASISEAIHKVKQKLWVNYKTEYNGTYNDKDSILKEGKNFIPNDDTIYNIVMELKEYEKIKKNTEKYRLELMKLWDNKNSGITKEFEKITKMNFNDYTIFVVDSGLDYFDTNKTTGTKNNAITVGTSIDKKDPNKLILRIANEILKKEIKDYRATGSNRFIADAIIDMAINNELATRVYKKSCYFVGNPSLAYIKRQIYPYWLMYLGVLKSEMVEYMCRDKVAFDVNNYTYDKSLRKMNLEEFIDYCIANKNKIVKEEQLELI